jgi:hypothetical protein
MLRRESAIFYFSASRYVSDDVVEHIGIVCVHASAGSALLPPPFAASDRGRFRSIIAELVPLFAKCLIGLKSSFDGHPKLHDFRFVESMTP